MCFIFIYILYVYNIHVVYISKQLNILILIISKATAGRLVYFSMLHVIVHDKVKYYTLPYIRFTLVQQLICDVYIII